ncbi:MAG: iron ABC transporter permease [Phycisphaerales bacterium]|nr:iron ABC transporter permease [Planctomycetota bacterium]
MQRFRRQFWQYFLLVSTLGILFLLLVYPIVLTVAGAFEKVPGGGLSGTGKLFSNFTLDHFHLIFQNPNFYRGLINSTLLAITTTTVATAIALPLALLASSYKFPGKAFFNAAVLVPMILPPFVGAIGVRAILGREGAFNALFGTHFDVLGTAKFWGVVGVQAFSLFPIVFLNATASLANLDPALDEAAENLGAGWWKRLFRITLPLVRPGIFAGATIVFIWAFTELGTPLMFDYYSVTSVQIYYGLKQVETSAEPYALTLIMLVTAVGMYVLGKYFFGRAGYAMYSKASRAGGEKELTGFAGWAAAGTFAVVFLLAILPHVGVVLTSFTAPGQWYDSVLPKAFTVSHYREALTARESFGAITNSLKLSIAAMIIAMGAGVVIAYVIVRTQVKGRALLDALCMLPLAVPGLVMAFGYVAMSLRWPFGKDGPLGDFVSVLSANPSPVPLLVAAYAIRRLPYIVRSTVAGLEQTSGELEEAAMNLGASRLTAVRRVIVPLIMANIIAGGMLVFSFSMLEVSVSMLLAQQKSQYPLTQAIFAFTERLGDGVYIASAMGVWGMALLTVTLFGASALLGKKLGSIFRV